MNENKIMKFGYEDTDKKIEVDIYGLIFEINKEEMNNKNIDMLNSNDENAIKNEINALIGENAVDRINEKRKQDGYNEMTIDVEVAILTCIFKAYMTASASTIVDAVNETPKEFEQYYNPQRNYNNNYNRYNGYNRYERRNMRYGRR